MAKITHQDFIEKLKETEILSLLYLIVEAKAGRHVDIVNQVPRHIIEQADTGIKQLIVHSKLPYQDLETKIKASNKFQ